MNDDVQTFEGADLIEYPTARQLSSVDVRIEVPSQYYGYKDLKGLIKFLKGIKRQMKEQM